MKPNIKSRVNYALSILAAGLVFCAALLSAGCASSKADEFRQRISKMPDDELMAYFQGINQRAGDLRHDIRRDEQIYEPGPRHNTYPTPFAIGGEGYDLYQKRKMVREELKRRNIAP